MYKLVKWYINLCRYVKIVKSYLICDLVLGGLGECLSLFIYYSDVCAFVPLAFDNASHTSS